MGQERRSVPRITPMEVFYVQFGEDTGGIVWNVSESGLGFHAATPMNIAGPVRIRLSPNPENRIEINGTIAWLDEARRYGGLQFIGLTMRTRELIRGWLAQSPISGSADEDEKVATPEIAQEEVVVSPPVKTIREAENRAPSLPPKPGALLQPKPVPEEAFPALAQGGMTASIPRVGLPSPALIAEMSARSRALADSGWLHVLVVALLICLVAAVPVAVFAPIRSGIGASLIRLGERLTRRDQAPVDAPAAMPAKSTPESPSNPESTPPQPTMAPLDSSKENETTPVPPGTSASKEKRDEPGDASQSPTLEHHQPSQATTRIFPAAHRSTVAEQLWAEVGSGNVSAEIALARLYLKGDGVARSCEQARVLLGIAAKHGSLEATRQLQNLRNYGCR